MQVCYGNTEGGACEDGGTCTRINRREEEEAWVCDCVVADGVNAFAGAMCRHPATEYCGSGVSFCTNGGTCRVNIVGNVGDLDVDG